jgi:dTDP-4-dehydrorhamnose reductase
LSCEYLVLGSTGMLGQALLLELKERGKTVLGIARDKADICLDITKDKYLLQTLDSINPKIIINSAGITSLSYCENNTTESYLLNSRVSAVISKYSIFNKSKYIYISTDHYYTGGKDRKHSENCAVSLTNEYATTKYIGEKLSLLNQDALIVRTNIVGFRYKIKTPSFIEWALQSLENNKQITLFNDFYTSSIDVRSFSRYLCTLIEKDETGIINLASSEVTNKSQFIIAIAQKLNLSMNSTDVGSIKQYQNHLVRNESLGLDVSKAEEILGCSMPNLADVVNNLAMEYNNAR